MTGRPTAEIVYDVLHRIDVPRREAADRLAELEAKLAAFETDAWSLRFREMAAELAAFLNALPPCPTCGGTTECWHERKGVWCNGPCPDCLDGKVPVERMAAVFRQIFLPDVDILQSHDATSLLDHLRSVVS